MSNRSDVTGVGSGDGDGVVGGARGVETAVAGARGAEPAVVEEAAGEAAILDLADVFSLLGDPGRLRLLFALRAGEVSVGELSALTGQSDSAVSHALQLLRAHRIVRARREGRRAYYRLDDPHVRMLLEVALTHMGHSTLQHPERGAAEAPQARAGAPHPPTGRAAS
jgi:ArsR family transcriptional regulator, lead/cadmium/zinc/bismuth-responsive transcriptional repressor